MGAFFYCFSVFERNNITGIFDGAQSANLFSLQIHAFKQAVGSNKRVCATLTNASS